MCGGLSSRPHTHVKVAVSPASTSRAFDMFPTNLPRSSAVSLSSAAQHRPAITTGPAHPPPKKNTITARHTPHHPHASQRQGKHISTTNTYMARYRRGFAARARAYDPPCRRSRPRTSIRPRRTPHSTRLRSAARLRPSLHTQTPPQTPHKHPTPGQQPAHTHTHTPRQHLPVRLLGRPSAHASLSANRQNKQKQTYLVTKRDLSTRMHHSIARPVRRRVDSPASASHQRESALAPALSRRQPRSRCGARRLQVHAAPAHIVREAAAQHSEAARTRRDPARTRREGGPAHERQ